MKTASVSRTRNRESFGGKSLKFAGEPRRCLAISGTWSGTHSWMEGVRQVRAEARPARLGRTDMTADCRPRHPDLIGADAALERAARRAFELALQTGTPCWVLRDGKMVDIASEANMSGHLLAPTSRNPSISVASTSTVCARNSSAPGRSAPSCRT